MSVPTATERRRLEPGTVLDERFKIVELLGAGNFGEVYRAKQLIFGQTFREVALKLFSEGVVTATNAHKILNDAIILVGLLEEKRFSDIAPYLVQVYDMGIILAPSPRAFMSMKLIHGKKTLKSEVYHYRHQGGMPVLLSLRYIRELLLPLAWMHGLKTPVVHGDLKPDNVMVTEDSHLILIDFGLAALNGSQGGTISYNAPEKMFGLNGEPAADVYAVGLIWYELLTGVHPFENVGLEATAKDDSEGYLHAQREARKWPIAQLNKNIPADRQKNRIVPASELNSDLAEQHPQIELLLNKCLAEKISERHSNARILLDKIDAYLNIRTLAPSDLLVVGVKAGGGTVGTGISSGANVKDAETDEMHLADASALVKQEKHQQALDVDENVLSSSPNRVVALLLQVRILLRMTGRMNDAIKACEKALGLAPRNPEVYETLAELRMAQGKPSQAADFRNKAAELRNKSPRMP